jgi:hypothetical protein
MHSVYHDQEEITLNWEAILMLLGVLMISASTWGAVIATAYVLLR